MSAMCKVVWSVENTPDPQIKTRHFQISHFTGRQHYKDTWPCYFHNNPQQLVEGTARVPCSSMTTTVTTAIANINSTTVVATTTMTVTAATPSSSSSSSSSAYSTCEVVVVLEIPVNGRPFI